MFLDNFEVKRSHVAIHEWVHKADLQPLSTVSRDQPVVTRRWSASTARALAVRRCQS